MYRIKRGSVTAVGGGHYKGSELGVGMESMVPGGDCVGDWEEPMGAEHLWLSGQPQMPGRSRGTSSPFRNMMENLGCGSRLCIQGVHMLSFFMEMLI